MESKIEKLRLVNHDLLLDYDRIEGKINEIIDHLNSQDQEEELHIENSGGKMFPVVGEIKPMSKKEWKEFSSVMDKIMGTPEEWEELTKEEWFMLKLAVNEINNKGNGAYDEISRKIDRLSKLNK